MSRTAAVLVLVGLFAFAIGLAWHGINRADPWPPEPTQDRDDDWGDGDWDDEDDEAITAEAQHGITQIETYLKEAADQ